MSGRFATATQVEKPTENLALTKGPNWALVALGLLLIALFVAGMIYARDVGSETKTTSPGTETAKTQETTTTTKTKNAPSDTLLTAILASGAVLLLTGTLYSRISAITLPGGGKIDLTKAEKEKVPEQVGQQMEGKPPDQVAKATQEALEGVRAKKAQEGVVELADAELEGTVAETVRRYTG